MLFEELKSLVQEVKNVFAPAEQQVTHIACIALEELLKRIAGQELQVTPPASSPEVYVSLVSSALKELKANEHTAVDCVNLTGSQLRELLSCRGTVCEKASQYVADGTVYPVSLETLMALCRPLPIAGQDVTTPPTPAQPVAAT